MLITVYLLTALLVVCPWCYCQEDRPLIPGTDPPCDITSIQSVSYLDDVDKFQGKWYLRYANYVSSDTGLEGYGVDVTYQRQTDGAVMLTFTYTKVYGEQDDCDPDDQWTCSLDAKGACKNGDGSEFLAILGIDFDSANGSFVALSEEFSGYVYYPILSIFVRDPFNFPSLDDVLVKGNIAEYCYEGADDPPSAIYQVQPQYSKLPACFLQSD